MRIVKQSKKVAPPHPELVDIINHISEVSRDELPGFLASIPMWMWPRSDLHSWVKVLNHFDDILGEFIEEYELEKLQTNPFTPLTKVIITEILRYETLLLENSTNRKLYASYDRLNSLLFSTDSDVLIGALQLLLRPSTQYSSQPTASHVQYVSTPRLLALASRWPGIREHGVTFADLFTEPKENEDPIEIPAEAAQVYHTFYRKATAPATAPVSASSKEATSTPAQTPVKPKASALSTTTPATPGPSSTSGIAAASNNNGALSSGMVTVHIPTLIDSDRRPVDILADTIEKHAIPQEETFELLCRIRVALSLGKGHEKKIEREKLGMIRLLAIAIFAHTLNETEAQNSLFIYEPDLIAHIAELIHPERTIKTSVQTAAIAALDGLARYPRRTPEVLAAINAGVTHGNLMSLLRKTVTGMANPASDVPNDFAEALISFVILLSSNQSGAVMIVGAGLVPLLIQLLQNRLPSRLQVISKVMTLIDQTLYGYGNAFQSFCNQHGVDVFTSRIQHEVDLDIEQTTTPDLVAYTPYGRLPFPRSIFLKHILRTMHRMMQQSGTSEAFRGLIDSSLPSSVRKIIEYRGLFGPAIFAMAINIMAAFVHNEPTSLGIIQEAGLPEAFYKAIDLGLESTQEVITAVPGAIGALCLNQAGLDQLAQRPTIIPRLFSILTSERHVKTLQEKENATFIGAAIDELVRHHPSLKEPVFDAVKGTFARIEELGNAYVIDEKHAGLYGLVTPSKSALSTESTTPGPVEDVNMDTLPPVEGSVAPSTAVTPPAATPVPAVEIDQPTSTPHEDPSNIVLSYIDIFARFLEGLLQHIPHAKEFVTKTDGIERICKLLSLPCLPTNFAQSNAAGSLIGLIKSMTEVVPTQSLERLTKEVKETLNKSRTLWDSREKSPTITATLEISSPDDTARAQAQFRQLFVLHLHIHFLASVYSTAGFAQGRSPNAVLPIITSTDGPQLITDLGALYRSFLWETILLKAADTTSRSGTSTSASQSSSDASDASDAAPTAEAAAQAVLSTVTPDSTTTPAASANSKAIKSLVQNLSKVTTPFFQAIVKLFLFSRRNPDPTSRSQGVALAKVVADVLLEHLKWRGSDDKFTLFTYSTLIVGLIAVLLFDERTSQNALHTLLLIRLRRNGALDEIINVSRSYATTLSNPSSPDASQRPPAENDEISAASTGLSVTLHLFSTLVSSRALNESGQTALLVTRDKPKSDPEYFEIHDFLIQLRSLIFPSLTEYWSSSWLEKAPADIVKLVVQGFLECMAGDKEEPAVSSAPASMADLLNFGGVFGSSAARNRGGPPPPDETRIQQLVDMGFPRASAERALARMRNNLSAATEYLLSHPFPLVEPEPPVVVPAPAPPAVEQLPVEPAVPAPAADDNGDDANGVVAEDPETPAGEDDAEMTEAAEQDGAAESADGSTEGTPSTAGSAASENQAPIVLSEPPIEVRDWKAELQQARDAAIPTIAPRALQLVDLHPDLVFELKRAFIGPADKYQGQTLRALLQEAKQSPNADNNASLAGRLRLLALVTGEISPSDSNFGFEDATAILTVLTKHLQTLDVASGEHDSRYPRWLSPLLLTIENLLIAGQEAESVRIPTSTEESIPSSQVVFRFPYSETRSAVFDFSLSVLAQNGTPRNDLIAVLRLLVLLTRDHSYAAQFVSQGGLPNLLNRFKNRDQEARGSQVHTVMIIRHIVEDRSVLEIIMKQDIARWFSHPRTKVSDVVPFLTHHMYAALRDPNAFIESIKELCTLNDISPSGNNWRVTLKAPIQTSTHDSKNGDDIDNPIVPIPIEESTGEVVMEELPVVPQSTETIDLVLKYLSGELLRTGKLAIAAAMAPVIPAVPSATGKTDDQVAQASSAPVAPDTPAPLAEHTANETNPADFIYACFLMQCLTEILSSYGSCKLPFITYSKRRQSLPAKDAKVRGSMLQYLLSEVMSFGEIGAAASPPAKRRALLANWAMSVIVALCIDTDGSSASKDLSPDLVTVRKMVLDAIAKGLRDTPLSESLEARYGRLSALADLIFRLLTFRTPSTPSSKSQSDSNPQIAKLMLEKNFVALLTNTLGELDLNYPNIRDLVSVVLRPLEHLTKIAIKIGRPSEKAKTTSSDSAQEEVDSDSSIEMDEDDQDDEETPDEDETLDLYRNSSLGMYRGEMDDMALDDELGEDEEEDEDIEMDYAEDDIGSDHTSETSQDDEDEEEEDIQDELELASADEEDEEGWHDEDEEGDMDGDEDEPDDIPGPDLMWEDDADGDDDVDAVLDELRHAGDDLGEEAGAFTVVPPARMPDDDDDDGDVPEMGAMELHPLHIIEGGPPPPEEFDESWGIFDGADTDYPAPIPRRSNLIDIQQYLQLLTGGAGRPPPIDPSTHPLMTESRTGINSGSPAHPHSRGSQRRVVRAPNGALLGGGPGGLINMIQDLIGEDGYHMIEQMLARSAPGTDAVLELRTEGGPAISIAHVVNPRSHRSSAHSSTATPDPNQELLVEASELSPSLTQSRWMEEAKMTHIKTIADRVAALHNHVVVALLPEARRLESARQKKHEQTQAELRRYQEVLAKEHTQEPSDTTVSPSNVDTAPSDVAVSDAAPSTAAPTIEPISMEVEPTPSVALVESDAIDIDMVDAVPAVPELPFTEAAPGSTPADVLVPTVAEVQEPVVEEPVTTEPPSSIDAVPEGGEQPSAPGPSQEPERVVVIVNGAPVDITDSGIDPTFLEALPDDMRAEVINQHFRERRAAQPVVQPPESQISPEFLEALPPEIRAELLQQEREGIERARRTAQSGTQAGNGSNPPPAAPSDMDSASFLATLDPHLRQSVLMEQDDGFIQSLPPSLLAEASNLLSSLTGASNGGSRPARPEEWSDPTQPSRSAPPAPAVKKAPAPRDAVQLLDKSGVATLVKLLFFPQVLRKHGLHKVLVHLCENSKTRTDLFTLLLGILQDGTGDISSVDRSFSQLSFRTSKAGVARTPVKPKAGDAGPSTWNLSQHPAETIPNLVAHRCIEALNYIVNINNSSTYYFLSEHEALPSLKRTTSRKGKGKEKQVSHNQLPLVLLLGLLERDNILESPPMINAIASLLSVITRPLSNLKAAENADSTAKDTPVTGEGSSSAPATTASDPTVLDAAPTVLAPQAPAKPVEALDKLRVNPPRIPPSFLRLIANILTTGECSARTFHLTLTLIQHLSALPDARDIIASELKTRAEELGQHLNDDLDALIRALDSTPSGGEIQGPVVSKFSPASADQAKLLRILKTLDFMFTHPSASRPGANSSNSDEPSTAESTAEVAPADTEKVSKIYDSFHFGPMWRRLGDALSIVESRPELDHIATVLLPLIEALMVVCKYVGPKVSTNSTLRGSVSPRSPVTSRETAEDLFVAFTDAHRKVLNLMVRNNPSLMSGSFSLLVNNPKVLDFDNKRNYFTQQLRRRSANHTREHYGTLQLNVRRQYVFEDSYQYLQRKTGEQIKFGKLNIRFYGEEGVDAGGVTREWFSILARQMFNPDYALFQPCAADKLTYQPNGASAINPEHLFFFKFVGRIIGKAIFDGRLLEAYFARSLYRQLLGKPVDYRDVEWVDPEYYNSLCWILENDPTVLDMNFTVEADEFGVQRIIELKENGANIPVTNENKREFVQLSAQNRLHTSIKDQIEALLGGFYEIIPKELISIFNEQEVELLISGTPDIDIDEWRAATEYHGYSQTDPVIAWWWRALKSFNRDERAKVLSFVTGTSRVPLGGFVELQGVQGVQRFSIHRAYGESDRLPSAHTCFNQLDLPEYTSYEKLRTQLLTAINEGGEGFGFA